MYNKQKEQTHLSALRYIIDLTIKVKFLHH